MELLKWLLKNLSSNEKSVIYEDERRKAIERVKLMNIPLLPSDTPLCAQEKHRKLAE